MGLLLSRSAPRSPLWFHRLASRRGGALREAVEACGSIDAHWFVCRDETLTILGVPDALTFPAVCPDELVNTIRSVLCTPFAGPVAVLKGTPTVMLSVKQFRM